ncbi:MAG: helix-turn-helix transcriptional regulator [Reichenbachiella sp.]
MLLEQDIIKLGDRPLYERAKMPAPFQMQASFSDMACFFYIIEGNYETVESHGTYVIGAKEGLVKSCSNYLSRGLQSSNNTLEAIAVYLYPEVLREIFDNDFPRILKQSENTAAPKKIVTNNLLEKYISNLMIYFENPELVDEDLAKLKLKELVLILLKSEQYQSVSAFMMDLFAPSNLEFTSAVENNIFSNICIEELAFICHKSLSSFKREFKKVYKDTPARYLKRRRLECAAKRLIAEDEAIARIAFQCGFHDPTTFSSAFQEKYGCSPSSYRLNQNRKKLA